MRNELHHPMLHHRHQTVPAYPRHEVPCCFSRFVEWRRVLNADIRQNFKEIVYGYSLLQL